ncbi:uncharacterized protein NEMAJ01_1729 [Nematocida major]|uniref:uncharacterized protein n=1 Tax=Nematocida major TaxID=1912982 RepID=UPI002008BEED|nr:uncharacterized protein NEMAJ01_1729 [Nematocida major]KAH9386833.1 hypothetical protein NEMAJ01_1729 [Nematocida major]
MKAVILACLLLGLAQGIAIQKIIRPRSVSVMSEIVPQAGMGIKLDATIIEGSGVQIMSGMKDRLSAASELVSTHQKNIESREAGEFEVRIVNDSDEYANISVSIYVDKAHEDTDEAEVLRKLLDKVRVDLMNIYNDILKLKNANTTSLVRVKSAKNTLWVVCIFPVLYVFLSYWRLQSIKGFFSTKKRNKI